MKGEEQALQSQAPVAKSHTGEGKEGEKLTETSVLGRQVKPMWEIHRVSRGGVMAWYLDNFQTRQMTPFTIDFLTL